MPSRVFHTPAMDCQTESFPEGRNREPGNGHRKNRTSDRGLQALDWGLLAGRRGITSTTATPLLFLALHFESPFSGGDLHLHGMATVRQPVGCVKKKPQPIVYLLNHDV